MKPIHKIILGFTFLFSVIMVLQMGGSYVGMTALFIGIALAFATVADLRNLTIPNRISLSVLMLSLLFMLFNQDLVIKNTIAMGITGVILMIAYFMSKKQIGLGDVKILVALSLFLGAEKMVELLLISTLLAGLFGLGGMVLKKLDKRTELPFMPFVFIGYYYVILM